MKNKRFDLAVELKSRLKEYGYFSKQKGKYVIEVNMEEDQLKEIEILFHEFTHFICEIQDKLLDASLEKMKDPDPKIIYVKKKQFNEERLCDKVALAATKEFRKYFYEGD